MKMKPLILSLALLTGSAKIGAQQPLTLAEAQAEARAHAPQVAELDARLRGTQAIAAQARRILRQDPVVSSSYFNGALLGRPDENSWSVDAKLPVDFSGSWTSRSASASADVTRTQFERDDGLRLLDEAVAVAVADVELQQRLVDRGQRILDLYWIAADAAHRQFNVGQVAQLDVDSADLDLSGARVSLEQARGELARVRTRLARLLGRASSVDVLVADPPEAVPHERPDLAALVDRDPRVKAALAEIDAATFERKMFETLAKPMPTFGISSGYSRRDIPIGSFTGLPLAGALASNWADRDLVFSLSLPIPLFDRQLEPRARATGRLLAAESKLRSTRADVAAELESTWGTYESAARTLDALSGTPTLIERDAGFVEQAVRAGQFDATTRVLALRRLEDAGRRLDEAVRALRAARAALVRRTSGLQ